MKKFFKYCGLFILISCISTQVFAQSADDELRILLDGIAAMHANFTQVIKDERGKTLQRANGEMFLKRPNKFYWKVKMPSSQLVVADGKNIWIYDRDLQQATVKPLSSSLNNTPASLLIGDSAGFNKQYRVQLNSNKNNQRIFQLNTKRSDSPFVNVKLFFTGNQLLQMELRDQLSQTTRVVFNAIELNRPIDEKLFAFKPPQGTDVIGTAIK